MPQRAFKSTKRTRNLLTLLRTKDTLRILPTISIMHRQHRCLTIIPLCLTFHPFRCKGTIRPTTRILSLSIRLTKRFRRRKPRPPRRQKKVIDLWLSPRANQYYYQISNKFTYHYISLHIIDQHVQYIFTLVLYLWFFLFKLLLLAIHWRIVDTSKLRFRHIVEDVILVNHPLPSFVAMRKSHLLYHLALITKTVLLDLNIWIHHCLSPFELRSLMSSIFFVVFLAMLNMFLEAFLKESSTAEFACKQWLFFINLINLLVICFNLLDSPGFCLIDLVFILYFLTNNLEILVL